MASEVTYQNLLSESWQNVYDLVKDNANVADPVTTSAEFRKWVYSRDPDVKAVDFPGFPFVIVHPALVDFSTPQSLDGKRKFILWTVEVEVISSDRAFNGQDGKGLTHNDAISDDILETFNSLTHRNTLSTNSLKFSKVTVSTVTTEPYHNSIVYRRSCFLTFKTRKEVSA